MPRSLAEQLGYSTVEYVPNGLRLSLFNVPTDSFVQVQFLIAWSDTYSDESPSTAFAVDQAPKDGVSQLSEGSGYHGVAADKLKGKEGVVI